MAELEGLKNFFKSVYGSSYGGMLLPDGRWLEACPEHSDAIHEYYGDNLPKHGYWENWYNNEGSEVGVWSAKYDMVYLAGWVHVVWTAGYYGGDARIVIDIAGDEPTREQARWIKQLESEAASYGEVDFCVQYNSRPYSDVYRSSKFNYLFDGSEPEETANALEIMVKNLCRRIYEPV